MTEVERLTAGSYYPLGRDPEWEARRAGLTEPVPTDGQARVRADVPWPSGAWNDPWEAEAKWRAENPEEVPNATPPAGSLG